MNKVAVLIPCYNESQTIAKVVRDFKSALPGADIYVYDNNSTDHTDKIARSAGAVVRYERRQGKGNVLRTMFREIDADCYVLVDGDDTYPAEFAPQMCSMVLEQKADMVIGDRLSSTYFTENKRLFHNSGNVLVRWLINFFWKGTIKDVMTGYRAFSPAFVKSFPILSKGFEIETEMTIHALDKNMLLMSLPVTYRDRPKGSVSKLNTVTDGIKVIKTIFMLCKDYRPLYFFSMGAMFFLIFALLAFIPVFWEYLKTGFVPRVPTLIMSICFAIIAVQSFVCGTILDTVAKKDRQNFEIKLNMLEMLRKMEK
jgi:glycosyltransferase involved in cell wall biosynthesis